MNNTTEDRLGADPTSALLYPNLSIVLANYSVRPCKTVWSLLAKKQEWTLLVPVRVGFIAVYSLIFILGLTGNLAMIYAIIKRKRLKNVANFFLVSERFYSTLLSARYP